MTNAALEHLFSHKPAGRPAASGLSGGQQLWPQWCNVFQTVLYNVYVDTQQKGGSADSERTVWKEPLLHRWFSAIVAELSVECVTQLRRESTAWITLQPRCGSDAGLLRANERSFVQRWRINTKTLPILSVWFIFSLHRTGLKTWCWTTGRCLTATLAPGLPSWLRTSCIITSPYTFRRCWRSSALPTCWLPRVWERSPSITTSPRRPSVHSPGRHHCGVQRGHLALPAAHPHASLPRRRFHRRAWWSEPLRMLSRTW